MKDIGGRGTCSVTISFTELLASSQVILSEGAVVERINRHTEVDLDPHVAHAGLIYSDTGRRVLGGMLREYIDIALKYGLPMLSLAPTWRANPERVRRSAFGDNERINGDCVRFLKTIVDGYGDNKDSIYTVGMMACRGDAYDPAEALDEQEAADFHATQAAELAESGVDLIKAATLPAVSEARGMAQAISPYGVPYGLSFVIRPDGTVLDGTPLCQAVASIDEQVDPAPAFYMVNCVHPEVFLHAMEAQCALDNTISSRVIGLQANSSRKPPEQLDGLEYLDTSTPDDFAAGMMEAHARFGAHVLGGCCGTDQTHIAALARRLEETP